MLGGDAEVVAGSSAGLDVAVSELVVTFEVAVDADGALAMTEGGSTCCSASHS